MVELIRTLIRASSGSAIKKFVEVVGGVLKDLRGLGIVKNRLASRW